MRKTYPFIALLFVIAETAAQNYTILGSASQLAGCNCFRLTPDANDQGGAIYQNQTINLNNSFDFTFSVFLGCRNGNDAADGIVFVLTSNPNGLGQRGEYLGYGNGSNQPYSLAVEFDTWENGNHGDPPYDHIAIESGGSVDHTVTGYAPALPGGANIDNCQWYTVRIVWDVNTGTFSVYFNGALVQQIINPNLVNQYFAGNPIVNWGWSGATGGGTNDQQVCINSTSSWVAGVNYQSCDLTLQFTDISTVNAGTIQSWAWDFGDNTTSALQNPTHTYAGTGTYPVTLTITDVSGCTKTYQHDVVINPPIAILDTIVEPLCNGGDNGSIHPGAIGGFGAAAGYGGYSYTWNGGQWITREYLGATAGTYTLSVSDGVCTATAIYTLSQPPPLTASVTHTDATCGNNDGTATLTLAGGTPPYTAVDWGWGGIGNTVTGLAPGTYVPDFHDFNGCSSLLQYRAVINSLPCGITSSVSSTDVRCFGESNGTATATVSGGGLNPTITWSNGGNGATITGLTAGTYSFTYTDNVPGNTFSGSVNVNAPGAPMTVSINVIDMSCDNTNDGQALASVLLGGIPPFTYAWSRGQPLNLPSATNLSPGAISVLITDANGCTANASGVITGPPALTLSMSWVNDSCYHAKKGSATATASGGNPPYTYYWDNISTAETNLDLGAGTYRVTITDNKGCTISDSVTLTEPDSFTHILTFVNIDCFGSNNGSILVTPSGGTPNYSYIWNPASAFGNNPAGLAAGQYNLTVADANNCRIQDSIIITEPASALVVTSSHTDALCNGAGSSDGTITLNISGGSPPYTYQGNPVSAGVTIIPGLQPGTYSGNVIDSGGCSVAVSETITGPAPQTLVMSNDTVEPCNGSSSMFASALFNNPNPPGTDTYAWTGGLTGSSISGLAAGVYVVTATDGNGCSLSDSVTITEPPAQVLPVSAVNALCFADSGTATANPVGAGVFSYFWSSGDTAQSVALPEGVYSVTATDINSCNQISDSFAITQPSEMVVAETHGSPLCIGNSDGYILLSVSGGTIPPDYVYSWNPNVSSSASALNIPAGNYSVTITDANGCSVVNFYPLVNPPALTLNAAASAVVCNGQSNGQIVASATGGTLPYSFSATGDGGNAVNSSTGDFTGLNAGIYALAVTDSNGCVATDTQTVSQPDEVIVDVTPDSVELPFGQTVQINVSVNQSDSLYYGWSPETGLTCYSCANPQFNGTESQLYTINVSTEDGCTGNATLQITVLPDYDIFIPNAFTPNNDAQNDYWQVFGNTAVISSLSVKVFNRWGEKVFESDSPVFKWDGSYRGKALNPDVYVYFFDIKWHNKPDSHFKGSLSLLK